MKIDTSSYYPEVGGENEFSLNKRSTTLFGDVSNPEAAEKGEKGEKGEESNGENPGGSPVPEVPRSDWERVADGVSHFLSWVLVPLLMPVYGLLLAFSLSILDLAPTHTKVSFTLIVAGINVLIPMLLVVLLKKMGIVNDLGLNGRKERLIPYIISIVALAATAVFMYYKGAPHWLVWFFGGGAIGGAVNLVVNFWWKISAHAAGIGGVVALLVRIARDGNPQPGVFGWLLAAIILAGLLGSARVWLGRHTVWQVMAGLVAGFSCVIIFT